MFRRFSVLVAACALLGAACSSASDNSVAGLPSTSATTAVAAIEPVLRPSVFDPGDCEFEVAEAANVACGWLTVPENRRDASSDSTVRLHVGVYEAKGEQPAETPLILVLGGPALEWTALDYEWFIAPLAQDRSVVLFDARGTGYSEPSLACAEVGDAQLAIRGQDVSDEEWLDRMLAAYGVCRDRLVADDIDLNAYNSTESAADVADLAAALGYAEWNVMSVGSGALVALRVLRDHPDGVRSAILDSPYPLQANPEVSWIEGRQRTLDMLFSACASEPRCSALYPDLEAVFWNLVDHYEQARPTIFIEPPDDPGYEVTVDGARIVNGVLRIVDMDMIPWIPCLLTQVHDGDTWALEELFGYGPAGDGSGAGARMSAYCSEEIPFVEQEAVRHVHDTAGPLAPGTPDHFFEICERWQVQEASALENEPVVSDVPALVLVGEYTADPPPSEGFDTCATLSRSRCVELSGSAGWQVWHNPCSSDLARAFLRDPGAEIDFSCVEERKPIEFQPPDAIRAVDRVRTCDDLATLKIDHYQWLLDEIGNLTTEEYAARQDQIAAAEQEHELATGSSDLMTTAESLGCVAELTYDLSDDTYASMCAGLGQLEAHGPAGEQVRDRIVAEISMHCPFDITDEVLATRGLVDTVELDTHFGIAVELEAGADALWVTNFGTGQLLKIDPIERRVAAASDWLGAFGLTVTGDGVWFTSPDGNTVRHANYDLELITTVEVGRTPTSVAHGGGSVWVINSDDRTVSRIDVATRQVVATILIGATPGDDTAAAGALVDIAGTTDSVWVLGSRKLYQIDPTTNTVRRDPIDLTFTGSDLAVTEPELWVTDNENGSVVRIDPATGAQEAIPIGPGVCCLTSDSEDLWVATEYGAVYSIDTATNDATELTDIHQPIQHITADAGNVWVLWSTIDYMETFVSLVNSD